MAKANIETAAGTKIVVEGSASDISEILSAVQRKEVSPQTPKAPKRRKAKNSRVSNTTSTADLIVNLSEQGIFDKPKGLIDVKNVLEEQGHIYPVTSLSPVLLRLVKKRVLRRLKEDKRWVYVKAN